MTCNIYSFCVSLIILYVDHCYFAILIILKTRFTFRSISDRSRPIPWYPDKEEKNVSNVYVLRFHSPLSLQKWNGYGVILCWKPSQPAVKLRWPGHPERPRAKVSGSPGKEGSVPFGTVAKVYVCQPHRTTLHHDISKQERLLITPAKESCSVFERSIFKRETAWAVRWFNTC